MAAGVGSTVVVLLIMLLLLRGVGRRRREVGGGGVGRGRGGVRRGVDVAVGCEPIRRRRRKAVALAAGVAHAPLLVKGRVNGARRRARRGIVQNCRRRCRRVGKVLRRRCG